MYKCKKCGQKFKAPESVKETHTQCPEFPFELFWVCPFCQCGRIERIDYYD